MVYLALSCNHKASKMGLVHLGPSMLHTCLTAIR